MAVIANFRADFTAFHDAVQKATGEFKDFAAGAADVGKALNRMVDQFSGRKLVADAALMVKAVEDIGGVSKLTEAEMKKLGTTVVEATTKMRAMGIDVPQKFQDIEKATQGATKAGEGWTSWLKNTTSVLGAFGISLGIGAIVQFGRSLLADADALQKMSDRTGIGVEGLQRLQIVGDDVGNTIEEMTGAINQMQNRLVGGDKSAVAALEQLGINLEAFLRMNPDQQFIAISDALRQIQDPAQQVSIAMDLFGKTGAQVLPSLKKGFDDVKGAAVGMSADTVKAMDAAGDAMSRWWRTTKGYTSLAIVEFARLASEGFDGMAAGARYAKTETDNFNQALKDATAAADRAAPVMKALVPIGLETDLNHIYAVLDRQKDAFNANNEAAKKAGDELKKYRDTVKEVTTAGRSFSNVIDEIDGNVVEGTRYYLDRGVAVEKLATMYRLTTAQIDAIKKSMEAEDKLLDEATASMEQSRKATLDAAKAIEVGMLPMLKQMKDQLGITTLESKSFAGMMGLIADQGKEAADRIQKDLGPSFWQKLTGGMSDALSELNDVFVRAFEGGGGIGGAIKSMATKLVKVGLSLIPVVGQFLSQFAGAIVAGFSKLFKSAESQINPLRQKFVEAAGGLDMLRDKATAAGITINELLNAKNAKQYEEAIRKINEAFEEHANDINRAKELMSEYGISIEETGQKWRDQQLQEQTKGLIDDYRIMVDVLGLSVAGAAEKMAGKFNDFLHTAQKVGFEIPAEMKPILEQMVHLGLLTDEQGNAYEDLEDTGVTFAETFAKSIDRLIDKFDEFLKRLGLVPTNVRVDVDTYHHDHYDSTGGESGMHTGGLIMHGGGVVPGKILPFPIPSAHNGLAPGERLIKAQTGEAVLSRSDVARLGGAAGFNAFRAALRGGGGGGDSSGIESRLDRLHQELVAERLTSAQKLARAVRDEVQKVSSRRR